MSLIEEIIERLDFVDLVSSYVNLKKVGEQYRGLCPFHQEKTPSFYVHPTKKVFYCFGCKVGGGPVRFIELIENLSREDAVKFLAEKVGIELRNYKPGRYSYYWRLMEFALEFYQQALRNSSEVKEYLKKRKISSKFVLKYRLGYSPSPTALVEALKGKFSLEAALKVGLVIQKGRLYYDRFHGRLIFPIFSVSGKVIAFGGRVIGDGEPKYLNSPATEIYDKSKELYGLYHAKNSIAQSGFVIVTEGYIDVIKAAEAGFDNTVAPLGTAFTSYHAQRLAKLTEKVLLAFDSDSAGKVATMKAIDILLDAGIRDIRVVRLPEKDIADTVDNIGADEFVERVKVAIPHVEWKMNYIAENGIDYERAKLMFKKEVASLDAKLWHEIEEMLAWHFSLPVNLVEYDLRKLKEESLKNVALGQRSGSVDVEMEALKLYMLNSEMFERVGFREEFLSENGKRMLEALKKGDKDVVAQIAFLFPEYDSFSFAEMVNVMNTCIGILKKRYSERVKRQILSEIKAAQREGDFERIKFLQRELKRVMQELRG